MSGVAPSTDVVVVGGGIVGLSIAWRLLQRGATVTVLDAGLDGRASWAAAGMLTPVTEAYWGEADLLALTTESMCRWPSFASELESATGHEVGLDLGGVLAVGVDADDVAVIDDLHTLHLEHGLASERLRGRACRDHEPLLAPNIRGGLFAPNDGSVDPRRVVLALLAAVDGAGGQVERGLVDGLVTDGNRVIGIEAGGTRRGASHVVVAAGSWSALLGDLGDGPMPVRPVFGEVLRLRARLPDHGPRHTIRAVVHGAHVYVVSRTSGEIVVGATSIDRGYDTAVTARGAYELLRDAQRVVPALGEAELVEAIAGLRPGTPDNAPIIGPGPIEGLHLATGHYRNGILLTPITADAVAGALTGGEVPSVVRVACDPQRFVATSSGGSADVEPDRDGAGATVDGVIR